MNDLMGAGDYELRLDYALVTQLRATVAEQMKNERRRRAEDGSRVMSRADERQFGRQAILEALASHRQETALRGLLLPPPEEDERVTNAVHAALFGLGRLQPLIEDPGLNNIEVNGYDDVWLYRNDGTIVRGPAVADSDAELIEWVQTQATYSGLSSRQFNPTDPHLVIRLGDGSRLTATAWVCERPALSIRLYRHEQVFLEDLRAKGGFGDEAEAFFRAAVLARSNMIVSGETFAGKTTMLRALGNCIPVNERIITVEHFLELGFDQAPELHRDVVALEERPANSEGEGGVSMEELVEWTRRMNPNRLVLGEAIGGEIVSLLDGMSQGNDGSLSTIHARNSRGVFDKIALYGIQSNRRLPFEASYALTALSVDFVVHMSMVRLPDGRLHRHVASIREVVGFDGTQVVSNEVFATPPGAFIAYPAAAISTERSQRLAAFGYNAEEWRAA